MGFFNADECFGTSLVQALHHPVDTHARIHHHGHGAHLEHGKHNDEEFHTRRYHENGSGSPADTDAFQAGGQTAGQYVQLFEGQVAVKDLVVFIPAGRIHHGPFVRHCLSGFNQAFGDIGVSGHMGLFCM